MRSVLLSFIEGIYRTDIPSCVWFFWKTMEKIKIELGDKLRKILHIYIFAQEAYLYTEYFHNPATKEESELVTNSPHSSNLSTIMHIMFRTTISEISKLYSRSDHDKFRLESFIKSLLPSGHFREIEVAIDHVEQWQKQLDENKDIIDNILLLRSKLYAHTDNPMTDYKGVEISFKQIKVLLELAADILKKIYAEIFDAEQQTDSPTFDRDRFLIPKLAAKGEKDRLTEIFNRHKKLE